MPIKVSMEYDNTSQRKSFNFFNMYLGKQDMYLNFAKNLNFVKGTPFKIIR